MCAFGRDFEITPANQLEYLPKLILRSKQFAAAVVAIADDSCGGIKDMLTLAPECIHIVK